MTRIMRRKQMRLYADVLAGFLMGFILGALLLLMVTAMAKRKPPASDLRPTGVTQNQSRAFASIFVEAQKRLQAAVLHPPGRSQSSQDYNRAWAASQLHQVDVILKQMQVQANAWIGKTIPQVHRDGRKLADQQAKEAGVREPTGIKGSFSLVDQGTVQVFAREIAADVRKAGQSMGDRAKHILRETSQQGLSEKDLNQILAVGVIEGRPRETIKRLRDELKGVHGETVSINGREFDVRYYAEMVARTKTREASVFARHERLQELELDLVAIVGRVSDNFCTAFLGQVFSLGGKSTKYPAYSELPGGGPPFHPNCSKSTRPFVEALASKSQLTDAKPLADATKLLGMNQTEAQRSYKDLQLRQQVQKRYDTTEKTLFAA